MSDLLSKPLVLIIRDGWGISSETAGNAVLAANTPNYDEYMKKYPTSVIETSGEAVGLVQGSQGSSEVGHLNLGAGRIVEQEVVRINKLIDAGDFFSHPKLMEGISHCREKKSALHLMGLVQNEGVHAMDTHLFALLELARREKIGKVYIHFFSDGRDTPPRSAMRYLEKLEKVLKEKGVGVIASVIGRYWAMDRDKNYERIRSAYDCLIEGKGEKAASAKEAIEKAYLRADEQIKNGSDIIENDEFILPTKIVDASENPIGLIHPGDTVIHFNYRQDRAIQLSKAFLSPTECGKSFSDVSIIDVMFLGLTKYYDDFKNNVLPPMNMNNLLGQVTAANGLCQLRIAETQKFKHVTSFFNGKAEAPFALEERILVASPKVPEDQKPQMSADEVTELAVIAITKGIAAVRDACKGHNDITLTRAAIDESKTAETYDLIVINYANCDMVGHTGVFDAAVKAVETVDRCMGRVVEAALTKGGTILITSDHGNAESMLDPKTKDVMTAHTINPVELILVSDSIKIEQLHDGVLADIAPTLLTLLGVPLPAEMTGHVLIDND